MTEVETPVWVSTDEIPTPPPPPSRVERCVLPLDDDPH